jgi:hypothetical protein
VRELARTNRKEKVVERVIRYWRQMVVKTEQQLNVIGMGIIGKK